MIMLEAGLILTFLSLIVAGISVACVVIKKQQQNVTVISTTILGQSGNIPGEILEIILSRDLALQTVTNLKRENAELKNTLRAQELAFDIEKDSLTKTHQAQLRDLSHQQEDNFNNQVDHIINVARAANDEAEDERRKERYEMDLKHRAALAHKAFDERNLKLELGKVKTQLRKAVVELTNACDGHVRAENALTESKEKMNLMYAQVASFINDSAQEVECATADVSARLGQMSRNLLFFVDNNFN